MDLLDRLTAEGPKRILALDGGGIRGALTLGILAHLERLLRQRHGRPDLVLSDYFDLIGGTSTGSIIAAALATGWTVAEITRLYLTLGPQVFGTRTWRPWTALYDPHALEQGLEQAFGDRTLGDPSIRTGLCIIAKRADTGGTWRLLNHPRAKYYPQNKDIRLHQAVRASTAAPVLFVPERLEVGPGEVGTFVDGTASMAGNPALELLLVVTLSGFPFHWSTGEDRLLLVSVGTGVSRRAHATGAGTGASVWHWATSIPAMLVEDASWHNQLLLQSFSVTKTPWPIDEEIGDLSTDLLAGQPLLTYLRYNAWLEPEGLEALGLANLIPRLPALRAINMGETAEELRRIGERTGERDVRDEHFPHAFDLLPVSDRRSTGRD